MGHTLAKETEQVWRLGGILTSPAFWSWSNSGSRWLAGQTTSGGHFRGFRGRYSHSEKENKCQDLNAGIKHHTQQHPGPRNRKKKEEASHGPCGPKSGISHQNQALWVLGTQRQCAPGGGGWGGILLLLQKHMRACVPTHMATHVHRPFPQCKNTSPRFHPSSLQAKGVQGRRESQRLAGKVPKLLLGQVPEATSSRLQRCFWMAINEGKRPPAPRLCLTHHLGNISRLLFEQLPRELLKPLTSLEAGGK